MSTDAELSQPSETVRGGPAFLLKRWFQRAVLSRGLLTFLVMGLSFFVFGVSTYNIFMLLNANIGLIANYGWQALMDGAARQFIELIVTGYLSMAAYVVFKTCEYRLAHNIAGAGDKESRQMRLRRDADACDSG
jgi:hypothetical protein